MKKFLFPVVFTLVFAFMNVKTGAQALKVGVFDLDMMVQAMPNYYVVDSLVKIYENDSLGAEYEYYQKEYERLEAKFKADSALNAEGKLTKALLDLTAADRRKMALNIVYWQQIAQNKSAAKRSQLSEPLYNTVVEAYKKVLQRRKYTLILKPNTYELGFPIDNIFISVAKELKMTSLPQVLLSAGDDPDAVKQPAPKPAAGTKPKTK